MTARLRAWARQRLGRLPRPTLGLRLTLVFGGLFAVAGAILLATTYLLVKHDMGRGPVVVVRQTVENPPAQTRRPATSTGGSVRIGTSTPGVPLPGAAEYDALRKRADDFVAQMRKATLSALLRRSLMALGVMMLVAVGLGWLVARRMLRPLSAITTAAKRASTDTLHQRLRLNGPDDELKELADTFDDMLERLDASFTNQRNFAANASHELRTPLAIMRAALDVGLRNPKATAADLRGMGETARAAVDRSEHLVDGLLLLARSEQEPRDRRRLDLGAAAQDALDATRAERAELGLLVNDALEPAVVAGERVLLERAVANLVENAVRHNHRGGWIEVASGTGRDGSAWVRVANGGRRIPPEEVPRLFEPFRRPAGDRAGSGDRIGSHGGAGLGLSIVRAVATSHDGTVDAEPLPRGGLAMTLRLPAIGRPAHATPAPPAAALARV
jgi:signal transduction histidine kinase